MATKKASGATETKKASTVKNTAKKATTKKIEMPANEKRKILFAVSECKPFAATGGLGDVAGSLPIELAKAGLDVRVVMPLYSEITGEFRNKMKYKMNFNVGLSWRKQYCGVFELVQNGVTYYFLDNEYYFKRDGLYGHFDDGERFAFFSKAVVDFMLTYDFIPDVLHMHDWQTGLIAAYLKTLYQGNDRLHGIKLVFTIHNIEYQGKYGSQVLADLFGLPAWCKSAMEYDGCINIMKAAIVFSDIVSTVSPTYAYEILSPGFSHGLHHIIESNKGKLRGILNGIDYVSYNPVTDNALFENFSADSIDGKAKNKTELQKMLGLTVDESVPMIGVITRLVPHKGMDLVKEKIEELLTKNVQVVILGKGESVYEWAFANAEHNYPHKMKAIIGYNLDLSRKIYAASDLFLMPSQSEPCGLSQMIASRYGSVPIVRETGGLFDSIKDFGCLGGGNGYVFAAYSGDDMVYVINKALEDFRRDDWKEKVKIVMSKDFSWNKSAEEYIKMYDSLFFITLG